MFVLSIVAVAFVVVVDVIVVVGGGGSHFLWLLMAAAFAGLFTASSLNLHFMVVSHLLQ